MRVLGFSSNEMQGQRIGLTIICTVVLLLLAMDSCSLYYGCDRDNDLITLSDDTRQWTPYSQVNEVIFENESTESVVKVFEHHESVEFYDRGDECAPGTEEVILTKLLGPFTDTITVRLTRQRVEIENTNFELSFQEDTKSVYPTNDINKKYQNTLTIDQKVFEEVLVSRCSSCSELSEIVFSRYNGLVSYRLNNVNWTRK